MNDQPLLPPSNSPKRFFDVAPPQSYSPPTTARPVIVTNKPEQVDPMVMMQQNQPSEQVSTNNSNQITELPYNNPEAMLEYEKQEASHELPASTEGEDATKTESLETNYNNQLINTPQVSQAVVVEHKPPRSKLSLVLIIVSVLILLVIAIDLLLDAKIISINGIPRTHLITRN